MFFAYLLLLEFPSVIQVVLVSFFHTLLGPGDMLLMILIKILKTVYDRQKHLHIMFQALAYVYEQFLLDKYSYLRMRHSFVLLHPKKLHGYFLNIVVVIWCMPVHLILIFAYV